MVVSEFGNGRYAPHMRGFLGALISGIAGIGSQAMSNKSQRETNQTNMEIAQMNNEWNAREAAKNRQFQESMMDKANQFTLDQWNRENEYNSAASQRERLEAAGLNPYMAMNGGSAGTASSVSSAAPSSGSQAAPAQMPNIQAYRYDFSSVANAINSFFVNKKLAAETEGQSYVNQLGTVPYLAEAAGKIDGRWEFLDPRYSRIRQNEAPAMAINDLSSLRQQLQAIKVNNELTIANTSFTTLQADAQKVLLKYMDQQQQAELMVQAAQAFQMMNNGALSQEQMRTQIQEQLKLKAEINGMKINNRIAAETADSIIDAMNASKKYDAAYSRGALPYAPYVARARAEYEQASRDMLLRELGIKKNDVSMFMDRWVTPVTSSLGRLLGGSVSVPLKK